MITINGHKVDWRTFPGGEVQVRLPIESIAQDQVLKVKAKIKTSDEFMSLLLVNDAIKSNQNYLAFKEVHLLIPYLPYARQDRVCYPGEANSGNFIARLLMDTIFQTVEIYDVHSLKPFRSLSVYLRERFIFNDVVDIFEKNMNWLEGIDIIVAPDEDAIERAGLVSSLANIPYTHAVKKRDPKTGYIEGIKLQGDVKDKNVLVVGDICDEGSTFCTLADEFKRKGTRSWSLYVTHGIFSMGIRILYNAGYANIYTTDSFCDAGDFPFEKPFLNVYKL